MNNTAARMGTRRKMRIRFLCLRSINYRLAMEILMNKINLQMFDINIQK